MSILIRHTDEATGAAALAHLKAEQAALYERTEPVIAAPTPKIEETTLIDASIASGDAHTVKLVEATRRGFAATGDPIFLAAAERVARRGLRKLTQEQSG